MERYAYIPEYVLFDEELTATEKLIYCYVATKTIDGSTEISNLQIANAIKCTRGTVVRAITRLEDKGYLNREMVRRTNGTIEKRVLSVNEVPE